MKTFKKMLPVIFTLAVITVMLLITSTSASAATDSGTCGDNLTWSLDDSGVLTISGTGDMYNFDSYYNNHVWDASDVKSIVIGNSVTSIGNEAFDGCRITSVLIPDSVTSIGKEAFAGCSDLSSVSIGNSVTNIGAWAFMDCPTLTSISIPDSVISIGEYAFHGCPSLASVTIGDSVTSIGEFAFSPCRSLESITIPDSVTSIGSGAFANCRALIRVTIGDSVTSIGEDAFSDCYITDVCISDIAAWCGIKFDDEGANPLYYASNLYLNNELVTDLVIPDTVTSIGDYAFENYRSLTSVTIGDSVTSIGEYSFERCSSLTSVNIGDAVENIGDHAFEYCESLTCVTIGDSVTSIGNYAFYSCELLTSVTIPDSVTSIGFWAFSNMNNLTIYCNEHSYAHKYAIENDIEYVLLHKCVFGDYVSDNNATCTADGTKTAVCTVCGLAMTVTDEGTATGHKWSDWVTVTEPTYDTVGTEERKCSVCEATEKRDILVIEKFENNFTDIKESHWFYSSVEFVLKKGYMKGMSDTTFSPNSNITREQFVLILANIAGVDTNEYKNVESGFTDVKTGQWYSGAVTWAVKEGYVSGMSADKFGRGQSIQRAALARMLYSYASKNGIDVTGRADLSGFGDAAEFDKAGNAWMKEPVQWAVDAGVISGMTVNGKNCVNAKGTATRAQAARMLMQFDELIK